MQGRGGWLFGWLQGPASLRGLHHFQPHGGGQVAEHQHRRVDDAAAQHQLGLSTVQAQGGLHDLAIAQLQFFGDRGFNRQQRTL